MNEIVGFTPLEAELYAALRLARPAAARFNVRLRPSELTIVDDALARARGNNTPITPMKSGADPALVNHARAGHGPSGVDRGERKEAK